MKRIRLWVGLGISVVCLALALRGVDFEGLGQALQSVRWPYLVLAFSALLLAVWLRAVRWRVLFYPQTGLSLSTLFSIINIGYLFINVLPVRVGELVRAYLAGELLGTGTPRAFSTIVLERTLDVLTIVLLLLGLATFTPLPLWAVRAGLIAGAGAVVMIVVMIVVALNPERGVRMGGWLARWLPERFRGTFTAAWASLLDGFTVVKEPGQLLRVVLLSVAIWAGSAMINYWVLVGFTLPAPPTAALLVLCITALGMVIPSSPGYIGVFEYLVVLTLSLFAIDRDLALSYGLVLHGVNYVGLSLLGVVGLWKRLETVVSDDLLPVEQKFFDRKGRLARVMTFDEVREMGGRRIPTRMVLIPTREEGRRTEMRYLDIEFDVDVPESTFDLRSLERKR